MVLNMRENEIRYEAKQEGKQEGRQEGTISAIKTLMKTMKLSAKEAMDALEIPAGEQPTYLAAL